MNASAQTIISNRTYHAGATSMARVYRCVLLGLCLAIVSLPAAPADYTEVYYKSGDLRIQAYLYKPEGPGPFAAVIYNHGSRFGQERRSVPTEYIGRLLTDAGYVAFVPERRGYGKSDGPTDTFEKSYVVPRLQAETDDVLAALDYLRTLPFVDTKRIGIMGWSFGGIVTMFATGRSQAFAVAIDQAGGAQTWQGNASVRAALKQAAEQSTTPTLFMVAENDVTTQSITTLADIFKRRDMPYRLVVYPPFIPERGDLSHGPGHKIFSVQGVNLWKSDVIEFLDRHFKPAPRVARPPSG